MLVEDQRFDDGLRDYSALFVILLLRGAAAIGLVDSPLHGARGVSAYRMARPIDVARRAADGLDQRRRRSQKAFLVGVENRHQRNFRQIQSFAQQVDADQHVELAAAQIAQNLDSLQRLDLGMQIAAPDADLGVVFRQVFGHALGQGRDQHPLIALGARRGFLQAGRPSARLTGGLRPPGSIRPVGRMICSTTSPPDFVSS